MTKYINEPHIGLKFVTVKTPFGLYCSVWHAKTGLMIQHVLRANAEQGWVDVVMVEGGSTVVDPETGLKKIERLRLPIFIGCPERFAEVALSWKYPVRLQLQRSEGYRLQALSEKTNGLPAVKVDRTTNWGNPFVPGRKDNPLGIMVEDRRHAYNLYRGSAPLNAALVTAARQHLAGKNLACWCPKDDPYEDCCHGAVLLDIANS